MGECNEILQIHPSGIKVRDLSREKKQEPISDRRYHALNPRTTSPEMESVPNPIEIIQTPTG
ncbi:hypothetical protein J0895_16870 [Phormidium pseudopriestleyi FRX01]|uniref:Uncharacterized protein n=1 Tax=Phormidium pseudopriestleyi FRX01 TaxID=1759528 RepID=A0ABS3FUC6_9CYAN|nr:hypothetical protein [Phormidium pseudopriestleyi]MBO0350734.1 hypothetical protein [Phormidium pseudopriestleyi FRX01]